MYSSRQDDFFDRFVLQFRKIRQKNIFRNSNYKNSLLELCCESLESDFAFIGDVNASADSLTIEIPYISATSKEQYCEFLYEHGRFPFTATIRNAIHTNQFYSWDPSGSDDNDDTRELAKLGVYTYLILSFSEDYTSPTSKILVIGNRKARTEDQDYYNAYEGSLFQILIEFVSAEVRRERVRQYEQAYRDALISGSRTAIFNASKLILEVFNFSPHISFSRDEVTASYLDAMTSLYLVPSSRPANFDSVTISKEKLQRTAERHFANFESQLASAPCSSSPLTTCTLTRLYLTLQDIFKSGDYARQLEILERQTAILCEDL